MNALEPSRRLVIGYKTLRQKHIGWPNGRPYVELRKLAKVNDNNELLNVRLEDRFSNAANANRMKTQSLAPPPRRLIIASNKDYYARPAPNRRWIFENLG